MVSVELGSVSVVLHGDSEHPSELAEAQTWPFEWEVDVNDFDRFASSGFELCTMQIDGPGTAALVECPSRCSQTLATPNLVQKSKPSRSSLLSMFEVLFVVFDPISACRSSQVRVLGMLRRLCMH